jgi:hypothetical protein
MVVKAFTNAFNGIQLAYMEQELLILQEDVKQQREALQATTTNRMLNRMLQKLTELIQMLG